MKKRNLNFLLALLAALALVFAGACSDGSDDTSGGTGGNENTPGSDETTETYSVAGKTYVYEGTDINVTDVKHTASNGETNTYLASVELEFAESGTNTVGITVTYQTCVGKTSDHAGENLNWTAYVSASSYGDSEYTASVSDVTYTEDTSAKTVTVTLPESAGTLTFSVDSSSNKLTLTAASKDGETLETYTVTGKDSTNTDDSGGGCDILDGDSTTGALTASSTGGSEFELDDSNDN